MIRPGTEVLVSATVSEYAGQVGTTIKSSRKNRTVQVAFSVEGKPPVMRDFPEDHLTEEPTPKQIARAVAGREVVVAEQEAKRAAEAADEQKVARALLLALRNVETPTTDAGPDAGSRGGSRYEFKGVVPRKDWGDDAEPEISRENGTASARVSIETDYVSGLYRSHAVQYRTVRVDASKLSAPSDLRELARILTTIADEICESPVIEVAQEVPA